MTADAKSELCSAMRQKEIVPYFQPHDELRAGRIVCFEVLSRWHHPTGKIVYPNDFIPLAESAGLSGPLCEHLLHQACVLAAQWPPEIQIAMTISPLQL